MEGPVRTHFGDLPATRRLHSWEVALLNGMDPAKVWGSSMRLAIAGIGQLASPIQSCWIISQALALRSAMLDIQAVHPIHCLWNHLMSVYRGVEPTQPTIAAHHPSFRGYFARLHTLLGDYCTSDLGPTQVGSSSQEHESSQRMGRKDTEEKRSGLTKKKAATRTQEPVEEEAKQPAEGTRGPYTPLGLTPQPRADLNAHGVHACRSALQPPRC